MQNTPIVDIIVPCYNAEKYVEDTIKSIVAQTFKKWRLVLVDDLSTDSSWTILTRWAERDARISVFKLSEKGYTAGARNHGLRMSAAKYVAFCDADDMWRPQKLEEQIKCLECEPRIAFSFTNMKGIDGGGNSLGALKLELGRTTYSRLLRGNIVPASSVIARRELLDEFDSRIRIVEDFAMWLSILRRNPEMFAWGLEEDLLLYRIHSSAKTSNKLRSFGDTFRVLRVCEQIPLPRALFLMSIIGWKALRKFIERGNYKTVFDER